MLKIVLFIFAFGNICWATDDLLILSCNPDPILEGQAGTVTVEKADKTNDDAIECLVAVEPSDYVTATTEFISLNNDNPAIFDISTVSDNQPGDYQVTVTFVCNDGDVTVVKAINVTGDDTNIVGDPHFSQLIVDERTRETQRICYDVTGKSGDYIEIYTHQKTKTYVYGQLMDDYYMHAVKVFSSFGNVTVSVKYIKFNNELLSTWGESNDIRVYHRGGYIIRIDDKQVDIEVTTSENMKFRVTRSKNPITGYFMDFGVFGLLNYDGIDGLLGRIGNNLMKFYDSVQAENNSHRSSILVNGRYAVASRKSEPNSCWLVGVKDVLHPYPLSNYILRK